MAVYTQVSDEDLKVFLERYDVGGFTKKTPIAEGVENTNYRVETERGFFILTLFEKRTNEADLPFFMALTGHLAAKGLPAPAPIKTKSREVLGVLAGRPAVLIEFLPGRPVMEPRAVHCSAVGATLAGLHDAVSDFRSNRTNTLSIAEWRNIADACRASADTCAAGLAVLIDDELTFLAANWPAGLPQGVVHADLFPDNVLFKDNAITGVIDFYFSCTEFFAYDIAIVINSWCFDKHGKLAQENARALITAYLETRAFTQSEIDAFSIFLRASALRFLLTRLYDWLNQSEGAIVTVKNPLEYRAILEFHRNSYSPLFYGFNK